MPNHWFCGWRLLWKSLTFLSCHSVRQKACCLPNGDSNCPAIACWTVETSSFHLCEILAKNSSFFSFFFLFFIHTARLFLTLVFCFCFLCAITMFYCISWKISSVCVCVWSNMYLRLSVWSFHVYSPLRPPRSFSDSRTQEL